MAYALQRITCKYRRFDPETLFCFAQSTFVITRQLGLHHVISHCIRVE